MEPFRKPQDYQCVNCWWCDNDRAICNRPSEITGFPANEPCAKQRLSPIQIDSCTIYGIFFKSKLSMKEFIAVNGLNL